MSRAPLYPFLFAAYPVLALAAHNIVEISTSDIWRPLLGSLFLAILIFGLAYLVLRDWYRAALVTSLVLLLLFTYGQIYAQLKGISLSGTAIIRHRTLGPLWAILLVGGIYWLGWKFRTPQAPTGWLNLIAILLLLYPTATLILGVVQRGTSPYTSRQDTAQAAAPTSARPDIYYIILDAYGRKDVLYDEYHYDNTAFLEALRSRGFYVAECSQSNYAQTELSLSSSMNMNYLDQLGTNYSRLIRFSALRSFLEAQGYQTAAFATGFHWTEIDDAKYYFQPAYKQRSLSEFENLLLGTTVARIYLDNVARAAQTSVAQRYRARTLSALDNIVKLPEKDEPIFAFVHIVSPHPPYVFDAKGDPVYYDKDNMTSAEEVKGYTGQVAFINDRILAVVDTLLAKSSTPPIIIIQGDHGPRPDSHTGRMRILNAYYASQAQREFYPGISPVNTFRILLNNYFGQNYPLLEDKSYYSTYRERTDFELIPNSCPATP